MIASAADLSRLRALNFRITAIEFVKSRPYNNCYKCYSYGSSRSSSSIVVVVKIVVVVVEAIVVIEE
jgi:hypothetical protein